MTGSSVLFDAPGPRARVRNRLISAATVVVAVAIAWVIYTRLDEKGQLTAAKWEPFLTPDLWRTYILPGIEGTLTAAQRLTDAGLRIIGVPKTIDNDLKATDYSFGFDTAVQIATEAVDRLRTTAESHERCMVLEVMGRHVGWIALHAGVAGGANVRPVWCCTGSPTVRWSCCSSG